MTRGPCAKLRVRCFIFPPDKGAPVFVGENDCATPQAVCPRAPGEGYEKCASICQQAGHAEVMALKQAADAGVSVRGGTATVAGHYWICEPCGRALRDAGIVSVIVRP